MSERSGKDLWDEYQRLARHRTGEAAAFYEANRAAMDAIFSEVANLPLPLSLPAGYKVAKAGSEPIRLSLVFAGDNLTVVDQGGRQIHGLDGFYCEKADDESDAILTLRVAITPEAWGEAVRIIEAHAKLDGTRRQYAIQEDEDEALLPAKTTP